MKLKTKGGLGRYGLTAEDLTGIRAGLIITVKCLLGLTIRVKRATI